MSIPKIVVLYGGVSNERAVSLMSGRRVASDLGEFYQVELIDVTEERLLNDFDPRTTIIVPMLHGAFGEDGGLQSLLESQDLEYVGSDSFSSALCMDKIATKERLSECSVRMAPHIAFISQENKPSPESIVESLGNELILKPVSGGSTLGVQFLSGLELLQESLMSLEPGYWMLESRVFGYEVSLGVLHGKSLEPVGINTQGELHDYEHKYTPGMTLHELPAKVTPEVDLEMKAMAETAFKACGCRDFARVDFIVSKDNKPYFLEINTIPGMTPTSIFPDSAMFSGMSSEEVCQRIVQPAIERHRLKALAV